MKKAETKIATKAAKLSTVKKIAERVGKVKQIDIVRCEDSLMRPPWAASDPQLRIYYDTEWGMPITDEQQLFERLSLEAFQAGLSWSTIFRKRDTFRLAFAQFNPEKVARFTEKDIQRLMADPGIVRHQAKVTATINNAAATIELRKDGGLSEFIWSFKPTVTPMPRTMAEVPSESPESIALSKALRKRGFSFVGPTTIFALMESIGMVDTHLVKSHRRGSSGIWPA